MLGHFVLGAFVYGFAKARLVGGRARNVGLGSQFAGVAAEELTHRAGLEHAVLRGALGMAPGPAMLVSSGLFGLAHYDSGTEGAPPAWKAFRVGEAALGGALYSLAYQQTGFVGAVLTHVAHNLGCQAGAHRR